MRIFKSKKNIDFCGLCLFYISIFLMRISAFLAKHVLTFHNLQKKKKYKKNENK